MPIAPLDLTVSFFLLSYSNVARIRAFESNSNIVAPLASNERWTHEPGADVRSAEALEKAASRTQVELAVAVEVAVGPADSMAALSVLESALLLLAAMKLKEL